jgi:cytochrome c biogenesis protein CcmG/thiol:disulfide interchange protein DsbE
MIPGLRRSLIVVLILVALCWGSPLKTCGQANDAVAQAITEGKLYESKHKWDLAFEAYRKADKLSHHASAEALMHMALIEKKAGLLSEAANDAKKAVAAAGENKSLALQSRLLRAALLTSMANKPTDNKLKDAEAELRMALTLDPQQPVTHLNLGMVLLKQEKDAEGVSQLKTFVAMPNADPESAADARRTIANPIRARTPFVPEFDLTTLGRQSISNASLRGKVALIDFWGTWCPPCRESVPLLKNIQKKYSGKPFQLLSISSDDDEDIWKTFIQSQHMDWAEYLDSSGELQERFKVDSFPTYLVVDKDGVIRYRQSGLGPETQMEIEEAVNKALKRESNPDLAKVAAEGETAAADSEKSADTATGVVAPRHDSPAATANTGALASPSTASSAPRAMPGNVYVNSQIGLRYVYPEGWIRAKEETLRATNDRFQEALRAALVKQQAQDAGKLQIIAPSYIFYASRRGDGSPERASLPSISMRTEPTRMESVDEDIFRQLMDRTASMTQLNALASASSFEVKKHKFVRADYERSSGALHYYLSYVQTVAGNYLVKIEIVAETAEQLREITGTLQTMEIEEAE